MAPVIPKLRGKIAEILNEGSLDHLGTLIPTHLSRFRYGRFGVNGNEAFLDGLMSVESSRVSPQLPLTLCYIRSGFACPGIT